MIVGALRTIFAVLRTASTFSVDDGTNVENVSVKMHTDFIGSLCELVEWSIYQSECLFSGDEFVGTYFFFQLLYRVHAVISLTVTMV